jgi:NOL1/NOP2/fmu family ribosome biogenesis protein
MFQILDNTKKKRIIEQISYLGIKKIPFLTLKIGREAIRAFSGDITRQDLSALVGILTVEGIGIYFGKELEEGTRLSLDMLHILKDQIEKNKIFLNAEQEKSWFLGKNIELAKEQQEEYKKINGFVAVISSDEYKDIIGTGKISQDKKLLSNFLPKERRIKN